MPDDKRTCYIVVDDDGEANYSVKNTEGEARSHADILIRHLGTRRASVYRLVATYSAEPVVKVVDADPSTDGRAP